MDSDFKTALDEATKDYDPDLLRPAMVRRIIYPFAAGEDPQTFIALVNGAVPLGLAYNNTIFWLDEADTTTPHDGVTVIRTFDDYCYKVEDIDMRVRSVLSASTTVPPVSPADGDAYIVPAGATGAWSSHQDDIAVRTPRGWVFQVPGLGRQMQIEDTDGMMRYSGAGWVYGYGSQAFDADSIPYSASLGWGERLIVENQTQTSPPAAVKGLRYVVGSPATGAYLGKEKKITICEDGTNWVFYTPEDGLVVFDKALQSDYRWSSASSAWISASGSWVDRKSSPLTASGATTAPSGSTIYIYSGSTAPTTSQRRIIDAVTLSYAAKKSGAVLRIRYTASYEVASGVGGVFTKSLPSLAIFRDAGTNAVEWRTVSVSAGGLDHSFELSAPDSSPHTYTVAVLSGNDGSNAIDYSNLTRRRLTVEEAA